MSYSEEVLAANEQQHNQIVFGRSISVPHGNSLSRSALFSTPNGPDRAVFTRTAEKPQEQTTDAPKPDAYNEGAAFFDIFVLGSVSHVASAVVNLREELSEFEKSRLRAEKAHHDALKQRHQVPRQVHPKM